MADSAAGRGSNRQKARQSIAHMPSSRTAALKDNVTTDIAALQAQSNASQAAKKKSRGKSLGPGGLEALTETTGNLVKTSTPFAIKSILKPTIPLTPPKAIPTFDELRKRSTGKGKSPSKHGAEDLLIDFSTPAPNREDSGEISLSGVENVADPFSPMAAARRTTPRKSEAGSAEAVAREQEEEERKRKAEKQAILERRAARRKSLANRRVSFAPEATLHTWSVMELAEDSTTSSASNSTRRQSSMTAQQSPSVESLRSPEKSTLAPSTPTEQSGDPLVKESPAHQRDLHQQKRRRRSSGLPEVLLDASQDDVFSSSPSGDITTNSSPMRVEEGIESSDESDTDGDTAMSMDEDTTAHTAHSQDSASSTHSSLEDRLRQAANQAGTRGIEYDEHDDDMSMEMATGTVTNAFQPWARTRAENHNDTAVFDQENVNHFAVQPPQGIISPAKTAPESEDESQEYSEDMSMEVTKAVGGIIPRQSPERKGSRSPASRRRSSIRPRRSSENESSFDQTMEFTVMQGGILQPDDDTADGGASDDDVSMDFTRAVGGVLASPGRREALLADDVRDNETMDMTAAVGRILMPIEEHTEPQTDAEDDQTMAMEMTRAVGAILKQNPPANKRATRQSIGQAASPSPTRHTKGTTPASTPKSEQHMTSVASETGSPSLALKPRLSGRSQRSAATTSSTPKTRPQSTTPVKSPARRQDATPSKQITPLPARAETPNKTPLSANVTHRGASPKKLFKAEIKARNSPASVKRDATLGASKLFSRDAETGQQTPSVILRATGSQLARRRSSGIGLDKDGIGSPRVSQILDRRTSIGDEAPGFKLGGTERKSLRFDDLHQIEHEVDAEREEEHRRESGRFVMEQEADEHQEENATLQLKDMIGTMSPPKRKAGKLKGRKSLAVGGAKGILGKRPAELDMDEEDEVDTTPKRLRTVSREGSPVKKVHLPKPPSKDETTGRLSTRLQMSLQNEAVADKVTPTVRMTSPARTTGAASPHKHGRYKDVEDDVNTPRPTSFEDKLDNVVGAIDVSTAQMELESGSREKEKISLQQFLNMTNVHFIELSTTKRRHTMAQSMAARESQGVAESISTEANFVAAATTLPLLELYQHATRELKSYISTGRKIIRSIEAETLAEQPALFREYVDARPDVKLVMDNQFRNGKANARLQSKEGWYQWRGQLVQGLKAGLLGINQDMTTDLELLQERESALDEVVPRLIREQSELQSRKISLQQSLEELDSVDHEALINCRRQLQDADESYLRQSALLDELTHQMEEKSEALLAAAELKTEIEEQIAEADRIREEQKGMPVADVLALKSRVEQIEKQTGWRLVTAEEEMPDEPSDFGPALVMVYRDSLRLFFHPQAFQCKDVGQSRRRSGRKSASVSGPSAPISLTFAPTDSDEEEGRPMELATEKRFFLQVIKGQLQAFSMMPKGSVSTKTLLATVSRGWDLACKVSEELRLLELVGMTTTSIVGDERLCTKLVLILPGQGRVDVAFLLTVTVLNDGDIVASTSVHASAIYGSATNLLTSSKTKKVQNALTKEIESRTLGQGAWISAVHGFEDWLRGHEGGKVKTKGEEETTVAQQDVTTKEEIPAAVVVSPPAVASAPALTVDVPLAPPASVPVRSPLAPKRTNVATTQKKSLPISKQRLEQRLEKFGHQQGQEKENFNPSLSVGSKNPFRPSTHDEPAPTWESAIPPEMQEAMMTTPIKRVGALRRSPI